MVEQEIYDKYVNLFEQLKVIIEKTNARIICSEPDPLFQENVNFFTKSFLVSICAYLESYLKEIAFSYIDAVNQKLLSISVPHNLIRWNILYPKDVNEKDLNFENLKIFIRKKDLDDHISGSPYRTETFFKKIGIDLNAINGFSSKKEIINLIVVKRNKVVHHNDDANDVSLIDLISYINSFIEYMRIINQSIRIETSK
jgi:hypothetical protein